MSMQQSYTRMQQSYTRSSRGLSALALLLALAWVAQPVPLRAAETTGAEVTLRAVGLVIRNLSDAALESRGLQYAVEVVRVAAQSPAARSGLEPGDLIYQLNGLPVYSSGRMHWLVNRSAPGELLRITALRGAVERTFELQPQAAGP